MIARLVARTLFRSPRRLLVGLLGIAVPVALFACTSFFVDTATRSMTAHALLPVQVDMQVLAKSAATDMGAVDARLSRIRHVRGVERFAQVDVPVRTPGSSGPRQVRLFAVDPSYVQSHPWVKVTSGQLAGGVLLSDPLAGTGGVTPGSPISVELPGLAPVELPASGTVDLRKADTWYALTTGDNQGDIHFVPDSMVVDYAVFEQRLLPVLRQTALDATAAAGPTAGGQSSGTAPPGVVSLQAHVTIDRSVFASDPTIALKRSTGLRRTLERSSPGKLLAVDNLGDALNAAKSDALNAKILFLFLGIPGVLVAAGLAVAAALALAAARRREVALLRLRGATASQIGRLTVGTALTIGVLGSIAGVGLGALALTLLLGAGVWRGAAPASMALSGGLAVVVGLAVTGVSLRATSKASQRASVIDQRQQLDLAWRPGWRRLRLDLWAIGVGFAVLGVNAATGGFRRTSVDGATLAATFYLLIAPIALWVGVTLLGVRALAGLLRRTTRPERNRPLTTWSAAGLRWLGRRPGRTASTIVIGALAVAFGTNLLGFVRTYDAAKRSEAAVTIGADVRVTPAQTLPAPQPPLAQPDVRASAEVHVVTITAGTDVRSAYAVDPTTYGATVGISTPVMARTSRSAALRGLAADPTAILVSKRFATDFGITLGDPVTVTVPDATGKPQPVNLRAIGTYTSAAPTSPGADLVMNVRAIPPGALRPPDFYLVRTAPGRSVQQVAARLTAAAGPRESWTVTTFRTALTKEQNTLATLNLAGLGRIETAGTIVIAALGIAVLGAFLVLERRREYAVMRSLGATTPQVMAVPAVEGLVTVAASVVLGVPVGLGMAAVSTRILNPLFTLRPPILRVDPLALAGLVLGVTAAGCASLAASLFGVARLRTVTVLRET